MTHLLTHGVQDFGCQSTVGLQSCAMCLYGERGVSGMWTLVNFILGAVILIVVVSFILTVVVSFILATIITIVRMAILDREE